MYYINPNISKLYRTGYSESRKKFLRLDMNENPEGIPKEIFDEIINKIKPEDISMYPESDNLINLLSHSLNCKVDNICLTNGSDDAIRLSLEVFGNEGKKLISVSPSFEMYSVYSSMYGMKHCKASYNDKFEMNIENILNLIDDETGIVVILNPNSPIGRAWTEQEVRLILEKSKKHNALVIIDEAYHYFYEITFLDLFNEYDNLMIFRTFSKLFSMAGCRIGCVIANNNIIKMLKNASSTYPVNSFAIIMAESILQNTEAVETLINTEKAGRKYLIDKLKEDKYDYYSNGGNYILIKSNRNPNNLFKELKEKNILIKTYSVPVLKDWIRVTTGSIKTMDIFWNEFKVLDSI